jgi:hypothetical protein
MTINGKNFPVRPFAFSLSCAKRFKLGPALRPDLNLQRMPDLAVASRPEFQGQELLHPRPHPLPDIVARSDGILFIDSAPSGDDMNVGMLGVPVIDGDPVEAGAQFAFGVNHEIGREGFDVGEFVGIFGRDNEPEMMPVLRTPLSEGFVIDVIALSAKHFGPDRRPSSRHYGEDRQDQRKAARTSRHEARPWL